MHLLTFDPSRLCVYVCMCVCVCVVALTRHGDWASDQCSYPNTHFTCTIVHTCSFFTLVYPFLSCISVPDPFDFGSRTSICQINDPKYDMLVIDTQGAEFQIIQGIIESVQHNAVCRTETVKRSIIAPSMLVEQSRMMVSDSAR